MRKQPARVSYFFGKGYRDIGNAIVRSWEASLRPCAAEISRIGNIFKSNNVFLAVFLSIFDFIVFAFMTVIGVAVSLVISAVLLPVFAVFMSIIYVLFMVLKFIDYIFCLFYGISSKCPRCQRKFMHPIYICPHCNAMHDRLVPSKYGILKRRCNCGHKIPTTFLNGRQKLNAICPHCKPTSATQVEANSRDVCCIPVMGGPSSGKTCYIVSAIRALESKFTSKGWRFEHLVGINNEYDRNMRSMEKGFTPTKTADTILKYYRFAVYKKQNDLKNIISLCDVAGESFAFNAHGTNISQQIGLRYADGYMMIIDPLSVNKFLNVAKKEPGYSDYRASDKPIDEVIGMVINSLEAMLKIPRKKQVKTSIAVVITKSDFPLVDKEIGSSAIRHYMSTHRGVSKQKATNKLCLDFLKKYGEHNFVNILKKKFKNIQFFTCSALGHVENGTPFTAYGVEEPVMWLLSQSNSHISLR